MQKIFVVDDEPDIVELIKITLEKEDYAVEIAGSADETLHKIERSKPDLFIVDLKLPGVSGYDLCRILKSKEETSGIPIIILSGRYIRPEERAKGIELGADDYMTKPFYGGELIARIKSVLKRMDYKNENGEIINCDGLIVNPDEHTTYIDQKEIKLTPKEFDLLVMLLKKRNKVLKREFLLETVWGYEYAGSTRTVDMHIARLREKLGEHFSKRLQTVGGMGYKWS